MLPEQALRERAEIVAQHLFFSSGLSLNLPWPTRHYLLHHWAEKRATIANRWGEIVRHTPMLRDGSLRASAEKGADR